MRVPAPSSTNLARLAEALGLADLARWARGPWRVTDGSERGAEGTLAGVAPHPTQEWVVGLFLDTPHGRVPTFSNMAVNVPANTARNTPHFLELEGATYGDSNALRASDAYGAVEHVGFGDFIVDGDAGRVYFGRVEGVQIPGQVGRSHRLDGSPEAVAALVAAVRARPVVLVPNPRASADARPRTLAWRAPDEELDGLEADGWAAVAVAPAAPGLTFRVWRGDGGHVVLLVPDPEVGEEALVWTPAGWESEHARGVYTRAQRFGSDEAARAFARQVEGPRERTIGFRPAWLGAPTGRAGWKRAPGGVRRVGADGAERWIVRDAEHVPAFYGGPRRRLFRVYRVPAGERPGSFNAIELGSRPTFAEAAELAGFRANPGWHHGGRTYGTSGWDYSPGASEAHRMRWQVRERPGGVAEFRHLDASGRPDGRGFRAGPGPSDVHGQKAAIEAAADGAPARSNPWVDDGERYVAWFDTEPRLRGLRQVGPSADWSDTAYQIERTPDTVLFEQEDDRWLVLRRYLVDEQYAGMPSHLAAEADGYNDVIEEVAEFTTPTEALDWIAGGGLRRPNPGTRVRPGIRVRTRDVRELRALVRAYLSSDDPHEWDEARTRLMLAGVDPSRLHRGRRRRNPDLWPADLPEPDDNAADNIVQWRERRRAFAEWLGDVASRAGFPALAGALATVARDPYAHGGTRTTATREGAGEAALETDPYHQTEAVRRRANVAAMRVLRAHQATRAPGGKMSPLVPGERQVLRLYSGMGGIEVDKLTADERALLTPAQQEYLRIEDARTAERKRIMLERGRAPKETELPQFGKVRGAFEGMIAQYFTPVEVAGGMVEWAIRVFEGVNGGSRPRTLLEPSAGIGRFLRAYELAGFGGSPRWDAVELDADLADMLRLLYADQPGGTPRWGDVRVHNLAFEQFYAANPGATYDLVVANPPYAGRGPTISADPDGSKWADAAHYFMWRTLTMLRAGGVMVHLVPAGLLTGVDKQSRRIREALLLDGHLASAVMPPYEIFPQALLNLCISVWVKRPQRLDRVLDEDQAILDGKYFEAADTRQGIMGKPQGGHYRPETITGEWNIETMRRQPIRVPPAALVRGTPAPAAPVGPGEAAAALAGLARPEGYDDESPLPSAEALGARVMRFRAAVETDPSEARAGQRELVDDLLDFARSIGGKPHDLRVPGGTKPSPRLLAFWSAFDERGGLTPALTQLVDVPTGVYQGERTPRAVCLHLCAQRGEAYLPDVSAVLGRAVQAAELVLEPDVYFEPLRDDERGPLVFYRADEYFSGEAYPKIDWCERVADEDVRFPVNLAPAQAAGVREKCRAMARRLVELVAPLPLGEVDIGVRSTWVHLARAEGAVEWDCPLFVEFFRDVYGVDVERVYVLQGVLVADGPNAKQTQVESILAYFNRVESTYDARGKKKSRQNENDALQDRIAADRKLDEQFAAFVRRHPDASKIEDRYNRAYRGWIERKYSTEPIPLARMPAERRAAIRPHAWAAVRRAVERRGGIMALDVGLGKTASSLLTIALLRQQGRVRRPVFVVPNSVGPNWLSEVAMWLPDYRAVLIGATVKKEPDGSIRTVPDNPARLLAKLQAFAAGKFDCAVIQQSTLERIPVDAERVREFFVQEFGVQREVALQKRKDEAARDRVKALQEDLAKATTDKKRQALQDQLDKALVTPWIARLKGALDHAQRAGDKKEVKRLNKEIDRFSKQQTPTDRQRQTDQQRFDEWIDARVKRHRLAIDGITWEELNADYVVVDEAHEYKNLYGPATRYGKKPKYMGAMAADKVVGKCWDLWAKCALLRASRDDTGVHLLTATPLKNSPLEAFNLLSYCTRAAFQARGLLSPEDFIDRYCRPESEPVLTVMGGFREDLVVKQFTSLHELRGIFATFVDVKVALPPDEYRRAEADGRPMNNIVELPLPTARPDTIHVPMDLNQEAYYDDYRRAASRAAEQAAAQLCERAMRNLDADPTQLPRLRLPMLEGADAYPQQVRYLHALYAQQPDVWRAAMDSKAARPLDGLAWKRGGFADLEELDGDLRAHSEVGRLYGEMRAYLENTDVRGAFRMDDPELGTFGAKTAGRKATADTDDDEAAAARPTSVDADDVDDSVEEEGEEDDLFTIMDRMGKAALDLRLLGESVPTHPPKYRAVAEKIKALRGCGHIVFSDLNETHPWIADAIERLAGVPRARIVSVTGALSPGERQAMANRLNGEWDAKAQRWVREPDIDVIIGGRAIEQGMNLQARSCAIHHLTFPWEPATIQQRNGRAVRQGNRLAEVFIFYYAAARSFDGYRLSLITGKRSWQRTLLESANRTTNNPGAELTGPCAMLRQLSSDEALADEYCACMENAAAKKAEAIRRERAAEDFASFVSALVSSKRDGPKQAYYAEQAEGLRARLLALDDAVFPRKDLIAVADRVPLYWDLKSGVPWIEGMAVCVANTPVMVEEVNPVKAEMRIRQTGRWYATTWTYGEASARGGDVAATCDWDEAEDRARLAGSYELRPGTLRLVDPRLWAQRATEGMQAFARQYALLPWIEGRSLRIARESDTGPRWRMLLPWTREDADAYLDAVRAMPRHERVAQRSTLATFYADYFGRVYPAELRDET